MTTTLATLRRWASGHRIRSLAVLAMALAAVVSVTVLVADGQAPQPLTGLAATVSACAKDPAAVVKVVAPAKNLPATVANKPEGTCFLLTNGTYQFHDVVPKNGMAFVGASTAGVIVDGRTRENAFHGTTDGVTIAQMTFKNFNNAMGTAAQEQAPIRGTSALWASDADEMATNWTITNIVATGGVASGIFLGDNFIVRNSELYGNGVTGIGGDSITGATIEGNIIHDNGGRSASGAAANGAGIKVTQAGREATPVIVRNNELYNNQREAIWCDLGCHHMEVLDNWIHDHYSRGIMFELSDHLVARGNLIQRSNTWTDFAGDFNAGAVTVGESTNALVENNRIEGAQSAVVVRHTVRPWPGEDFSAYPAVVYNTANVQVKNNDIRTSGNVGISLGTTPVTSDPATSIDPNTIVFSGNTYDSSGTMTFWWMGQPLSFDAWRAAGRDTTSEGSLPGHPEQAQRGPSVDPVTVATTSTVAPTTTTRGKPPKPNPTRGGAARRH